MVMVVVVQRRDTDGGGGDVMGKMEIVMLVWW